MKTRVYVVFEDGTRKTYRSFKTFEKDVSTAMLDIHCDCPVPGQSVRYHRNSDDKKTYRRVELSSPYQWTEEEQEYARQLKKQKR